MNDKKSLFFQSAIIVSLLVIASKALGFIRDALIAAFFGATYKTDAFFFASTMPGIPAISMSLSTVFLPQYVAKKINGSKEESDKFASNMLNVGMLVALIISAVAIAFAPIIVRILAPGFDEQTRVLAVQFSRIITATLFLIMDFYMFTAILNANKIFGRPQLSGIFMNIIYILAIIIGAKYLGVNILIVAAVIGAIVQAAYLAFESRKIFKYHFTFSINDDIKKVFRLTIPVLIGNAVIQIHEIVDQLIGSLLPSGSISILSYGLTLSNIVKTVIVNALSSVYYPYIAESVANDNPNALKQLITKTYSGLIMVLLPISLISMVCSREIVSIVYERGHFSTETAVLTSGVLLFYAIGFIFSGVREISTKTLYSINKMTVVTKNGILAVAINVILSFFLSKEMGVSGIALATSIAEIISAVLLTRAMKKEFREIRIRDIASSVKKSILAAFALIVIAVVLKVLMEGFCPILRFGTITIISGLVYFILLVLMKSGEANFVLSIIKKKLGKI